MEKKKLGNFIKNNLQKISIFLISLVYIAQGLFAFAKKDKSLWEVLGSIVLSIIVGVIISNNMRSMGLQEGRKSEKFMTSEKVYGDTKEKATPHFHKLFAWCEYKNSQELEQKKKEIITDAGLSWKGYKSGYYNTIDLTDDQKKAIDKANTCKLEKLTNRVLLSDINTRKYSLFKKESRFGESERDYKTVSSFNDVLTRTFTGIIFGLYMLVPLINGGNWQEIVANMLWNAFQIILWLAFGVIKYQDAYSFMVDEYRQTHIIQKTEYLNEFIVTMEKSPEVIENFDDEKSIDDYIKEVYENEQKTINN